MSKGDTSHPLKVPTLPSSEDGLPRNPIMAAFDADAAQVPDSAELQTAQDAGDINNEALATVDTSTHKRAASKSPEPHTTKRLKSDATDDADDASEETVSKASYDELLAKARRVTRDKDEKVKLLEAEKAGLEEQLESKQEEATMLQEQVQLKEEEKAETEASCVHYRDKVVALAARCKQLKDNDEKFRDQFIQTLKPVINRDLEAKHKKELARQQGKVDKAVQDLKEAKAKYKSELKSFKDECDAKVKDLTPENNRIIKGKDAELRRKDATIEKLTTRFELITTKVRIIIGEKEESVREKLAVEQALKDKKRELRDVQKVHLEEVSGLKVAIEEEQRQLLDIMKKKSNYKKLYAELQEKYKADIRQEQTLSGHQQKIAQVEAQQRIQKQRALTIMQNAHERDLVELDSLRALLQRANDNVARLSASAPSSAGTINAGTADAAHNGTNFEDGHQVVDLPDDVLDSTMIKGPASGAPVTDSVPALHPPMATEDHTSKMEVESKRSLASDHEAPTCDDIPYGSAIGFTDVTDNASQEPNPDTDRHETVLDVGEAKHGSAEIHTPQVAAQT